MSQLALFAAPDDGPPLLEYGEVGKTYPLIRIQLAQHTDGRWMWAVSISGPVSGYGYAPNPKWGKFASSRGGAVEGARQEAAAYLKEPGDKQAMKWLEAL